MACRLHDHDDPSREHLLRLGQNNAQAVDHILGPGVREPEQDDARTVVLRKGGQVAEVEIERQDDAVFCDSDSEDVGVRSTMHPSFAKVRGIVALAPEPVNHAYVHAHVGEEVHGGRL